MRPATIVYFERIMLTVLTASLLLYVLRFLYALKLNLIQKTTPIIIAYFSQVAGSAIIILIVLLISRKRSKIARWLFVFNSAIAIPMTYSKFANGDVQGLTKITFPIQAIVELSALALLFTPSARSWFSRKGAIAPSPGPGMETSHDGTGGPIYTDTQ